MMVKHVASTKKGRTDQLVEAIAPGEYLTRDGQVAEVTISPKSGMSIYTAFGKLEGKPCHWTGRGMYRMDGKDDPRDLVVNPQGK